MWISLIAKVNDQTSRLEKPILEVLAVKVPESGQQAEIFL